MIIVVVIGPKPWVTRDAFQSTADAARLREGSADRGNGQAKCRAGSHDSEIP
jgi:hypothetical protein